MQKSDKNTFYRRARVHSTIQTVMRYPDISEKADYMKYEDIPGDFMKLPQVSIRDKKFYKHNDVDLKKTIVRAAKSTIKTKKLRRQQYHHDAARRNIYLDTNKN